MGSRKHAGQFRMDWMLLKFRLKKVKLSMKIRWKTYEWGQLSLLADISIAFLI